MSLPCLQVRPLMLRANSLRRLLSMGLVTLAFCAGAIGTSWAGSSVTTQLLKIQAGGAAKANGDFMSSADTSNGTTGVNSYYRFYIEVPSGLANLNVDLFDADFGLGATNDALRGADFANSSAVYTLLRPNGTTAATVTGSNALPVGSDNVWSAMLSEANPANGHWELRVDSSAATGDDVNGFGIRAYNGVGNEGAAGVELPIYADTMVQVGNTVSNSSLTTRLYPWASADCSIAVDEFDMDVGGGGALGGSISVSNRLGGGVALGTAFSGNDVWAQHNGPNGDSVTVRNVQGIWTSDVLITTAAPNNYANVVYGVSALTASPTTRNPAGSYRIYLPSDTGGAPLKPYMSQYYIYQSGANPPVSGSNTEVTVVVLVANPTQRAVTFSATNLVRSTAPADARTSYRDASTVSQGTITAEPAVGSDGNITWNPGTLNAGATAVMTYRMRFSPNAAMTRDLVGAFGSGTGTSATWLDETGNAAQAIATYSFGELCGLQISTGTVVPTPVSLASFSSARSGDLVNVRWSTATETQNVGFRLVSSSEHSKSDASSALIPSRVVDSIAPQDYQATLSTKASSLWLEDIDAKGTVKRHGPYAVGEHYGEVPQPQAIDWQLSTDLLRTAAKSRAKTLPQAAVIEVKRAGIQRVSFEALSAIGVSLAGVPASSIALSSEGQRVARRIAGAEAFGPGSYIEFIGAPGTDLYGKTRSYLLSVDPERVLDVVVDRTRPERVAAASFAAASSLDAQRYYSFASPNGDPWFADRMLAFRNSPTRLPIHLDLPGRVDNRPVLVRIALWGVTDWSGTAPDHSLNVLNRGAIAAEWSGDGLGAANLDVEVLPRQAQVLDLELELTGATGYDYDLVHLESVRAEYRAEARAQEQVWSGRDIALDAGADGFYVFGFHDYRVSAYRRDADGLSYLPDLANYDRVACCAVTMARGSENAEYWVAQESAILRPAIRALATPRPPLEAQTDYLIITHPLFAGSINRLAEHHRSKGLRVEVINTDDIYRQLSDGAPKVQAIDDFIAFAVAQLHVRYVLLVGGDTYDYDDNLGLGSISFIPTHYRRLNDLIRFAPTDAPYADVDDDLLPDVALGRLPVRTPADLDRAIDKLLSQTQSQRPLDALFVAAAAEPGLNFTERAMDLRAALETTARSSELLSVDAIGVDGVRSRMQRDLQIGPSLVTYVGHSGVDRWSLDPLFTAQEASALSNSTTPSVYVQWGCWNTYFVSPYFNSMAHALLFSGGGASSVIGAAALTDSAGHQALGLAMYPLLSAGVPLGDAVMQAKRAMNPAATYFNETSLGVNLLGDPAATVF